MTERDDRKAHSNALVHADKVLTNGEVITMTSPEEPLAQAVAIRGGRILAVGQHDDLRPLIGETTEVIDLEGRAVLPGFIDTHMHVIGAGLALERVNCRTPPNRSIADVLDRIKKRAATTPEGEWIVCAGYNLGMVWEKEGRHINRWDLDKVAPNHPVQVNSVGGHTGSIYNSVALALAGIDRDTPDPAPPALIERDPATGEPSGRVSEAAEEPLRAMVPVPTPDDRREALKRAAQQFVAWGLTMVTDASTHPRDLRLYQDMAREGHLPVRIGAMVHRTALLPANDGDEELVDMISLLEQAGLRAGFGDERVRIIGMKIFADGAFTGRTAAMYEPYLGEEVEPSSPLYKGLLHVPPAEIHEAILRSHRAGLRPCIHAQGDYGIDVVLDGIEEALSQHPVTDHRIRIEHGGLTTPDQLGRIRDLGVCVSSSISFLGGDVSTNWVYWGAERMRWTYALKSFQEFGIVAAGNGDYPVTTGDPLVGIATAVTRQTIDGDIVGPEQAISVYDALKLYTTNAAYINREENIKGTVEPGKLADITVLSHNPLNVAPDKLREIQADLTLVGGEVVFSRL